MNEEEHLRMEKYKKLKEIINQVIGTLKTWRLIEGTPRGHHRGDPEDPYGLWSISRDRGQVSIVYGTAKGR